MRLYVPEIKDQLLLQEDWTFKFYPERRNVPLGIKLGLAEKGPHSYSWPLWKVDGKFVSGRDFIFIDSEDFHYTVTLKAGTLLQVDRIYIRKGNSDYSSLSFYIKNGEYKGARFWAKLKDVNEINFE